MGERGVFSVSRGNILQENVDAIVNAANSQLAHGGGVAASIARAAGPELERASRERVRRDGPVPVGSAVTTPAGALPHKGVIHAVGPREGEGQEAEKLTSAVASALGQARENGWTSVALPAISAGIFGVPAATCAPAYVAGVERHFRENPDTSVEEVRLVLFDPDPDLATALDRALDSLEGAPGEEEP